MPGYGIATTTEGLLPWSWAVERLTRSLRYWLATSTPAGAPHLAAVWAVWFDGAVCFSTGARSRKTANLAADSRCAITPEDAHEAVVVEGLAERVTGQTRLKRLRSAYVTKYGMGFAPTDPVFAVGPVKVFGVMEAETQFATRATRWRS
jgi:hypothetical protein